MAAIVHVLTSSDGEGSHSKPDLRADVLLLPWIIRNDPIRGLMTLSAELLGKVCRLVYQGEKMQCKQAL